MNKEKKEMSYCLHWSRNSARGVIYSVPASPHCGLDATLPSTMLASLSHLNLLSPPGGRYRLIMTFNDNLRGVNSLNFSKDGHYLASGGEYTSISIPKHFTC